MTVQNCDIPQILQTIVANLDTEDRLNASIVSWRLRGEVLRRCNMRYFQVTIVPSTPIKKLRNLLCHVTTVRICVGLVQPAMLTNLLHAVLTLCDVLECLDICKADAVDEIDVEWSEREKKNAQKVLELRASWYFTRTSCFKSLLRACTHLKTVTLAEPLCRFQLDDDSRRRFVELPFCSELSDGADILYFNFFDFLSQVAELGIRIDQFLADNRVPRRGEQNNSYAQVLDCVERAFQKLSLRSLALPRLAQLWNFDATYRILKQQAATLSHLGVEFVDPVQVRRVAQCVGMTRLRSVELSVLEPRLTSTVMQQFFPDSRVQCNLENVSLIGVRWSPVFTVLPRWTAVKTLSLSHVLLSNIDFCRLAYTCANLQRIRLSACRSLTAFDLRSNFDSGQCKKPLQRLIDFQVSDCVNISENSFEFFMVPSLRKFSLHHSARPLSRPRIWRFLADNCPLLACVSLKHREECAIVEVQLDIMLESIANLKCLRMLRCFRYRVNNRKAARRRPFSRCFNNANDADTDLDFDPTNLDFLGRLALRFPQLHAEVCDR